ncbi:MAG: Uma2 family endonuclease, partial [Anaerolineales bacterium]|nr:Uma2 family endonuclease [Anaerolineales bacterium]
SRKIDRLDKFAEYAQANVNEYWLVDPDMETVELFMLVEQAYELLSKADKYGTVSSTLLVGLQIPCQDIFAD